MPKNLTNTSITAIIIIESERGNKRIRKIKATEQGKRSSPDHQASPGEDATSRERGLTERVAVRSRARPAEYWSVLNLKNKEEIKMEMERMAETKAVKSALVEAGYTGVKVGHGRGTAWGWLHIECDRKPDQEWQEKYNDVERIAQDTTGRHGDWGGRINISFN